MAVAEKVMKLDVESSLFMSEEYKENNSGDIRSDAHENVSGVKRG